MACSSPFYLDKVRDAFGKLIPLSCRYKCLCCRQDIVNDWSNRATYEQKSHSSCCGLSLTYNDWWLPIECVSDGYRRSSLRKVHLQRFIDSIRHRISKTHPEFANFTWFASGEYGDDKCRPHYHLALYGVPMWLARAVCPASWRFGNIKFKPLKFGHISYFMKYILEDKVDKSTFLDKYFVRGMEFPFYSHSKGFGKGLYYEHRYEIAEHGCMFFGSRRVRVPSYWKNKFLWRSDKYIKAREDSLRLAHDADLAANSDIAYSYDDLRAMRIIDREKSLISRATMRGRPIPHNIRVRSDLEMYSAIISPPLLGRSKNDDMDCFNYSVNNSIIKSRYKTSSLRR